MRRSIAALCAAAAFAVPAPASGATAREPGAVADEEAVASWMFPTDRPKHSKWIFAGAYRTAVTGGKTVTTGFAVKGYCEVVRENGATVTRCHGRGIGGRLDNDDFEVDPALRTADLVLREDGDHHHLFWRADLVSPPSIYIAGEACEEGAGQGAGFMRHASAVGNLFDRRVGPSGIDHAVLSRGAMVTECTDDGPGLSLAGIARRAASGEVVRVTFR
ncbi:MAG TPA: hypothetical protein VHN37_12685 [Actinomycetota bacterium]|nr:hypothetical protein [Actinomycetota bacterium]